MRWLSLSLTLSCTSNDAYANPIFSFDVPSGSAISFPWFETYFIYVPVGKLRLAKWFIPLSSKAKAKIVQDLTQLTQSRRQQSSCNFIEYKGISISSQYAVLKIWRVSQEKRCFTKPVHPELTIEYPKKKKKQ